MPAATISGRRIFLSFLILRRGPLEAYFHHCKMTTFALRHPGRVISSETPAGNSCKVRYGRDRVRCPKTFIFLTVFSGSLPHAGKSLGVLRQENRFTSMSDALWRESIPVDPGERASHAIDSRLGSHSLESIVR
jgi:hypothetical protein